MPASKSSQTWKDTALWKTLEKRSRKPGQEGATAEALCTSLKQPGCMDAIETLLRSGGTSPTDFTLHNDEHSFRVAERIMEIIEPVKCQHVSDYELALLLLAAYLHDIGMSPSLGLVKRHRAHLLDPSRSELTREEKDTFQAWLDAQEPPVDPPLHTGQGAAADLEKAEELITFYVRHQHNEWSADWIRQHISGSVHHLNDFQTTLIRLCQSHHEDHEKLESKLYDPLPVGYGPQTQRLDLRYLACLLRMADMLENSPDRTPDVLFQHRNIEGRPRSFIYWQTDHHISLSIQGDQVILAGRPTSARIHKAILTLADAIDAELSGIAHLADRFPFDRCPGLKDLKRTWRLQRACARHFQAGQDYEYIEGGFRPNTAKLIQLLSGEQLYGNSLAAVRELIQNAFDAVREKIALQRLRQTNPADPKWEKELGQRESVTLTLEKRPDGSLILRCTDTGCGMTKAIIKDHLLVSGNSNRPKLRQLERDCKKAGFQFARTGQFGIGVLSYFMLARSVTLTTCRDQHCGDYDGERWQFTTHGVGDFGELRRLDIPCPPGTTMEWLLDAEKVGNPETFALDLKRYLAAQIRRSPCRFKYNSKDVNDSEGKLNFDTGWTWSEERIRESFIAGFDELEPAANLNPIHYSPDTFKELAEEAKWRREQNLLARKTLRLELIEAPLPDGMGMARVTLPYFDLPEGRSLTFLYLYRDSGNFVLSHSWGPDMKGILRPQGRDNASWLGIHAKVLSKVAANELLFAELDFICGDKNAISVSRNSFQLSAACAQKISAFLREIFALLYQKVMCTSTRFYRHLDNWTLRQPIQLQENIGWFVRQHQQSQFHPLKFPMSLPRSYRGSVPLTDRTGQSYTFLDFPRRLGGLSADHQVFSPPQKIMGVKYLLGKRETPNQRPFELNGYLPVWEKASDDLEGVSETLFPPEWCEIAWVQQRGISICFNGAHVLDPLRRKAGLTADFISEIKSPESWESFRKVETAEEALAHLYRVVSTTAPKVWERFQDQEPQTVAKLWQLCADAAGAPVTDLKLIILDDDRVRKLTPLGLENDSLAGGMGSTLLPAITDPEWLLRAEEETEVE